VRVKWLKVALANLEAEADDIAQDNPAAADRLVQKIMHTVKLLGGNPAMGRAGRVPGTRELIIGDTPYIVPYRVRADAVEVLRVFHTRRKWPSKL
jgi:toxin ParE1/3/4